MTPEKIDFAKAEEFATQLFQKIAARHFENVPAILVASPFVGDSLGEPLKDYQEIAGRFSDLVEPSFGTDPKPVSFEKMSALMVELSAAWNTVQLAMRDEFNTPPLISSPSRMRRLMRRQKRFGQWCEVAAALR